jgi:tRNA-splicing ligase RtcB (3'-phosphate/5'-hydroxy nucleic acid ligase)
MTPGPRMRCARNAFVKAPSSRGIAEEAPGACKGVAGAERTGLAKRVARLKPLLCIKG